MLRRQPLIITLLSLALLLPAANGVVTSPLRMCDSINCEIFLNLVNNTYNISIPVQQFDNDPNLVVCMRKRPIVNGTDNQCSLSGYDTGFACLMINIPDTSQPSAAINAFDSDATLTNANVTITTLNITAIIGPTLVSFTNSQFLTASNIYQAKVGYRVDLSNDPQTKLVFFHTFKTTNQTNSDNLFMQRNYQCYQYYYQSVYNYNLIFYGGTIRDGQNTMYFHVVSYLPVTNINLNMWGGISYSKSHAGRDMLGFSSRNGLVYDLYSIYFAAPFADDNTVNVGATDDVLAIASSYSYAKNQSYYYYMGSSRLYDTSDVVGDEIIIKKMGGYFCYAAGYSSGTTAITPMDSKYQHSYTSCWVPDVTVWENHLSVVYFLSIFLIMFCI